VFKAMLLDEKTDLENKWHWMHYMGGVEQRCRDSNVLATVLRARAANLFFICVLYQFDSGVPRSHNIARESQADRNT